MCPNCEKKLSFKKLILFIGVLAVGLISMNGYASGTEKKMDHSKMDHDKTKESKRKSLTMETKKSIISALEANEALHGSFFKYNSKSIEENAIKLKTAIDSIKDKEVAKLLEFSKTKLSEIKASNDRSINDKNYHLVSMALIHIIDKYDVGSNYNSYTCPMVKKKWIQNSKKMNKVHNPYAPDMPHCGSKVTDH